MRNEPQIQLQRLGEIAESLGIRGSNPRNAMGPVRRLSEALLLCRSDVEVGVLFQREPAIVTDFFGIATYCPLKIDAASLTTLNASGHDLTPYAGIAKVIIRFIDGYIGPLPGSQPSPEYDLIGR